MCSRPEIQQNRGPKGFKDLVQAIFSDPDNVTAWCMLHRVKELIDSL